MSQQNVLVLGLFFTGYLLFRALNAVDLLSPTIKWPLTSASESLAFGTVRARKFEGLVTAPLHRFEKTADEFRMTLSVPKVSFRPLDLVLKRENSFIDNNFAIFGEHESGAMNASMQGIMKDCFYKGHVKNFPDSHVSLMHCDGIFSGEVRLTQSQTYRLSREASSVIFTDVSGGHRFHRRDVEKRRNRVSGALAEASKPVRYIRIKLGVEKDVVVSEGGHGRAVSQIMQYAHRIADFFGSDGLDVGDFLLKPVFMSVYVFNLSPFSNLTTAGEYLKDWCSRMGPRRRLRERVASSVSVLGSDERTDQSYRNQATDESSGARFEEDYAAEDAVDVSMVIKSERLEYSQPISGLSYVNTTCSTMACGVVFTLGKILAPDAPVDNVGVFAHEIVHTLGAWNDGQFEKGNDCEPGLLMGGARNRKLSECTKRELRQSLSKENTQCLRDKVSDGELEQQPLI